MRNRHRSRVLAFRGAVAGLFSLAVVFTAFAGLPIATTPPGLAVLVPPAGSPTATPAPARDRAPEATTSTPAPTPTITPSATLTPTPIPPTATAPPAPASSRSAEVSAIADRLGSIDDLLRRGVERGDFASAVVLVQVRGQVVKHAAYGQAVAFQDATTPLDPPIPARPDTVYDIASITKLFTATAALQLVEQGRLALDAPISTYLPALAASFAGGATPRQLLTHTAGFKPGFGSDLERAGGDPLRALRLQTDQRGRGRRYVYSDVGFIALGLVIEAVSGRPLDAYVQEHIAGPLGLADTRFRPPADWRPRIAATEAFEPEVGRGTRVVWGEVHDPTAWRLGGVAGSAGLFSSARDLAAFGQMVLNGGELGGVRLLEPETVEQMLTPQFGDPQARIGLGWELNESWYMGALASPRGVGHTGFTGTSLVADLHRQAVVVLLTNRVHPRERPGNLAAYRKGLADLVARAIDSTAPPPDDR